MKLHKCGTQGCAIGYAPIALPKLFAYNRDGNVCVKGDSDNTDFESLYSQFDLTEEEGDRIFMPGSSYCPLSDDADRNEVANNIELFVLQRAAQRYAEECAEKANNL